MNCCKLFESFSLSVKDVEEEQNTLILHNKGVIGEIDRLKSNIKDLELQMEYERLTHSKKMDQLREMLLVTKVANTDKFSLTQKNKERHAAALATNKIELTLSREILRNEKVENMKLKKKLDISDISIIKRGSSQVHLQDVQSMDTRVQVTGQYKEEIGLLLEQLDNSERILIQTISAAKVFEKKGVDIFERGSQVYAKKKELEDKLSKDMEEFNIVNKIAETPNTNKENAYLNSIQEDLEKKIQTKRKVNDELFSKIEALHKDIEELGQELFEAQNMFGNLLKLEGNIAVGDNEAIQHLSSLRKRQLERKTEIEMEKIELIGKGKDAEEKTMEKSIEENIIEAMENSEIEKMKSIQMRSNKLLTPMGFRDNTIIDAFDDKYVKSPQEISSEKSNKEYVEP